MKPLCPEAGLASQLFRDRGFRQNEVGQAVADTMGCEPVVCSWPPLRLSGCAASAECATRRQMIEWSERSTCGPSQRVIEAGSRPVLEAQGLGGSSSDNDGTGRYCQTVWARQARR